MKRSERKALRQQQAAERQAAYDALTTEEKIARVRERCGHKNSNEERKLVAQQIIEGSAS